MRWVIILPQRQAVLVAKQAAEVDLLSEGRLRLGVGVGWKAVEYEALGEDFTNRGKRLGEQVEVMRRLWTERSVTFAGKHIGSPAPAWHRCPCNGPSRCGSVPRRGLHWSARAAWGTGRADRRRRAPAGLVPALQRLSSDWGTVGSSCPTSDHRTYKASAERHS